MKTITIHKIDKTLDSHIRQKARRDKTSLNKTVQNILSENLGLKNKEQSDDFTEFLGMWSEKDFKEFKKNISDLGKINPLDWK